MNFEIILEWTEIHNRYMNEIFDISPMRIFLIYMRVITGSAESYLFHAIMSFW